MALRRRLGMDEPRVVAPSARTVSSHGAVLVRPGQALAFISGLPRGMALPPVAMDAVPKKM
jgi:hypothetical protein